MQPTDQCDASISGKSVEPTPLCDQARQMAFSKPDNAGRPTSPEADNVILSIPAKTMRAAHNNADSADIMRVDYASHHSTSDGGPGKPPKLNDSQQQVYDALAAKGLNPTVEAGYFRKDQNAPSEYSWVLKANWKDGQPGDPELKKLTAESRHVKEVEDAHKASEQTLKDKLRTDVLVAKIPASVLEAAQNGNDSLDVATIGSRYSHGSKKEQPPTLNENQQRVFAALLAQGLNPSIAEGTDGHYPSWNIRANWKDGDGEHPDAKLSAVTKDARAHKQEQTEFEMQERRQKALQIADERIALIPTLIKQALENHEDAATIMKVAPAWDYSDSQRANRQPQLTESQQKVFDSLTAQNLHPTLVRQYYSEPDGGYPLGPGQQSWVIKAHWQWLDPKN